MRQAEIATRVSVYEKKSIRVTNRGTLVNRVMDRNGKTRRVVYIES